MSSLIFEPWHYYKIYCLVPKGGGGFEEKWKFWFPLISGEPQDGFFINSKERRGNPLQMEIKPVDINCYLPAHVPKHYRLDYTSFINFKQTKIKGENIFKVNKILETMPKNLADKFNSFLENNTHHISKDRKEIIEATLKKYL